jgi:hypothetical protein
MNTLYCVQIDPDTKVVNVQCIGMFCVDNKLDTTYKSCNDLPKWVQDKLAVLMIAVEGGFVEGVGYRSKDSFYIEE